MDKIITVFVVYYAIITIFSIGLHIVNHMINQDIIKNKEKYVPSGVDLCEKEIRDFYKTLIKVVFTSWIIIPYMILKKH